MAVTKPGDDHDRMLLEAARQACLQAAIDAYEDAGIRGLCGDGRWEHALAAVRTLALGAAHESALRLDRGGQFPHVVLRGVDGTTVSYGEIWQRRNLLLVSLAADPGAREGEDAYLAALLAHRWAVHESETAVVITRDPVPGLASPAVLIGDRWGEIIMVASADRADALPALPDILDWLRFVAHACPECQGEAR